MSNLERIAFIDSHIRYRGGISARDVAERFEVSDRQVKRDIEYLRYRLGAPIRYDPDKRRYVYEAEWHGLDFADEKALLFYVLARAAAGTLAYVPIAQAEALDHLLELVPLDLRPLESAVRYDLPEFEPVDAEQLALVLKGLREGRVLDAKYRDLEGRESARRLAPRRIVNYSGVWYLLAWDLDLRELRVFRARRFASLSLAGAGVKARRGKAGSDRDPSDIGPDEAEVDRLLGASYGMFKGPGGKKAVLRFFGRSRLIVKDELWHLDQIRLEGRSPELGPYVQLELPVSSWDEVLGRLLRFGAEGEAMAPAEFRERWLTAIEAMAARAAAIRSVSDTTQTAGTSGGSVKAVSSKASHNDVKKSGSL
jgi:predicted DNA-binding transcriptional regulator YafY